MNHPHPKFGILPLSEYYNKKLFKTLDTLIDKTLSMGLG